MSKPCVIFEGAALLNTKADIGLTLRYALNRRTNLQAGWARRAQAVSDISQKQEQAEMDSKARDKQNLNWTLAGAEKALADTERTIATGELPAGIGNLLAQIPRAEIERRRRKQATLYLPLQTYKTRCVGFMGFPAIIENGRHFGRPSARVGEKPSL